MRSGLHMYLGLQPRIQRVARQRQVGVDHLQVFLAAHRREKHARPIDADFQLMRKLEARQIPDDVA